MSDLTYWEWKQVRQLPWVYQAFHLRLDHGLSWREITKRTKTMTGKYGPSEYLVKKYVNALLAEEDT